MSKDMRRKSNFKEQEKLKDSLGSFEKIKQNKKKVIIFVCLIAVLLTGIIISSVVLFSSDVLSSNTQVTVAFDSSGGSEVESQTVSKGQTLMQVGTPTRNGYVFTGWYYEEAPVNAYKADDVFSEDTMLYAGWYQPEMESDIQEYLKDSTSDITFVVHSDVELTDNNLSNYISCTCVDIEDECPLSVKPQDDGYLLYSKDGFTPGFTYAIQILDTKTVYFVKAGDKVVSNPGIKGYNFTVHKENVNNVVMKVDPKLLSTDDVSDFEETGEVADGETGNENDNGKTIYRATLVKSDADYQVGDIVSFDSGEKDSPENQYYKVFDVINNSSAHYVDLIAPNLDDIYSELEVYYSGDAVYFEDEEETEETRAFEQELEASLKQSEGFDYICTAIARGIKESPTLKNTVAKLDINNQKRFIQLGIGDLKSMLENVEVKLSIQKTYDLKNKENGVRGQVRISTGDITIKLDDDIHLTLNLSLSNELTAVSYGYFALQDNCKANINQGEYLTNHCNIKFSAVIGTGNGKKTINITEEIQKLVNSQSGDKTQEIVDSMNQENFFGKDLSYVEIFSKELGKKTVSIYEILTVQFKLDFHIDVGMRVGLNLNFDSTEVRQVGMCNMQALTGTTGMVRINQRVSSHINFSVILKGQIGIRAGIKAEVNFSVAHLNDVVNFGFTADVGVYEEITGFVRMDYDSVKGTSLAGGLKSETGVYLSLEFSWNVFGWKDSVTIASFKFPILTIGAVEFASEFNEPESALTFNTTSYNIKDNGNPNLLKLKYIDISTSQTGVTINVKPAPLSEDYAFYKIKDQAGKGSKEDLKYVTVNSDTGMITIADNAPERLDFTVVVQYIKGCSLFSQDLTLITKKINLTYMKYKVDDSTKKYKATFRATDGSVVEQKEYYVGQIPVPPAEELYEDEFIFSKYRLVSWAKPWKEDIAAIYKDTDYHLDTESNYKNIRFYGDAYNKETGDYEYGLVATVPTLCGEMPTPPKVENAKTGWIFDRWSPELREAQCDYNYIALYKQDTDYSFCDFYVNGIKLSSDIVKRGDTPDAPDMSDYNTDDQAFMCWWPSLKPASSNFETYFAVFRKYVSVTFKDRDGKVLSEKRILAGKKPEAPKVDDVIKGEDDYFEYHFNHWATEEGARIDQVYADTVYSPVYDKKYLEVTTTFDAGDHTFADGTKVQEYKGVYATSQYGTPHILNLPEVIYKDNENTYTVDYWQSTEQVNGSYIKLYMSNLYTYYKYNLTFKPVFKAVPIEYKVSIDGGGEDITLTGHYGDVITVDMLSGLKKTSDNANYVYKIKDYGLTLPYRFGTAIGSDGLPAVYIGVVARFEAVGVDKTFAFDANGGKFTDNTTVKTVTAPYGTKASFNEVPVKANDSQYSYAFVGWSDNKDATTGSSFSNFTIDGDSTLYAVYTKTPIYVTLTFNSGSGHFADGSKQKIMRVQVGSAAPAFNDIPLKDSTADLEYTFTGWSPAYQPGTVVGSSASYYAQYSAQKKVYTVIFDAGEGRFAGGEQTITQNYNYGDTIVPPSAPAREGGTGYKYVFDGWNPALTSDTTVTWSRTFTATYHIVGTGAIGETGIIVTKDGISEDINVNGINGAGCIPGYRCEMVDYIGTPIPTLTVTGNGLTFSGTSSEVYVVIAPSATDVTFNGLTLSGAYFGDGALMTDETPADLTINISGNCLIRNTQAGGQVSRLERPVLFKGTGAGAKLIVSGNYGFYCLNTFSADSLEIEIDTANTAFRDGDGVIGEWRFTDSTISINSVDSPVDIMSGIMLDNSRFNVIGDGGMRNGYFAISGASTANVTANGENITALQTGRLSFEDFTGTFNAGSTHSTSPGAAVKAFGGIRFVESGVNVGSGGYNLGGTEIGSFSDGMDPYDSFAINSGGTLTPASTVEVTKP